MGVAAVCQGDYCAVWELGYRGGGTVAYGAYEDVEAESVQVAELRQLEVVCEM